MPLEGLKEKGGKVSEPAGSAEDEYLAAAFDAAKSGNAKAFTKAMREAIRMCVQRELGGDYDDED